METKIQKKRSKGITILVVLLILFVLYRPLRTAQFFVMTLTSGKLQLLEQKSLVTNKTSSSSGSDFMWQMVKSTLKARFFQLDRLKPIRMRISRLSETLPIYLCYIPQRIDFFLTSLILLINCSLLITALGLFFLKKAFLRVLFITVSVIVIINILNIVFAIPMLSGSPHGIIIDFVSSIVKLVFFGIVIYFFSRSKIIEQFEQKGEKTTAVS
jgi:hypothetical protein